MKYTILISLISLMGNACQSAQNTTSNKESAMLTNPTNSTPDTLKPASGQTEIATLGGGCFWCIEAVFQELNGVQKVESGYAGGHVKNPSYREVCAGTTGHAEVTQVTFDPAVVSFQEVLEVFFTVHNPTTPNQQGNDIGTQYRSAIFYHTPEQKTIAAAAVVAAAELWDAKVVTQVEPYTQFYKAEAYHQNYYKDNPNQPYCVYVVGPKVKKFRETFQEKLKQ